MKKNPGHKLHNPAGSLGFEKRTKGVEENIILQEKYIYLQEYFQFWLVTAFNSIQSKKNYEEFSHAVSNEL